jgi:hypothetical protein
MSSLWRNLPSSLFLLDKSPRRERWEEDFEAAMDKGQQSVHECFLGNETFLWWGHALKEKPFNLCSWQLQLRWYGLRSISMSCIDKHPSKTQRSIISAATVVILSSLLPLSEFPVSVRVVIILFVGKGTWGDRERESLWLVNVWSWFFCNHWMDSEAFI